MDHSRRDFLRRMGVGAGSAALLSAIENFSLTSAYAGGTGYRALVCIFLAGGNDGNNTLIPYNNGLANATNTLYNNARSAGQLAFTPAQLAATQINPTGINAIFAMHPQMTALRNHFTAGRLAFVCNTGPLVRPLTTPTPRAAYQNSANPKPLQLFSHSDQVQQWQTALANQGAQTGWGGRTADQFTPHASQFPMVTSIAGSQRFTIGQLRRPLTVPAANRPPAVPNLGTVLALNGFSGDAQGPSRRLAMDDLRLLDFGDSNLRSGGIAIMERSLAVGAALATADVSLTTAFPATGLGDQLLQVARIIKANLTQPSLGLTHQIFFVQIGGFDTHRNQTAAAAPFGGQGNLLTQVTAAMNAFYNATVELGVPDRVTQFTLSDFGRTMNPAGTGAGTVGSDHGWGNHAWVLGGSVRGGRFYGVNNAGTGTPYPDLRMGAAGTLDTDSRGRWVPTTSVEQYANTLAAWFGLPQTNPVLDAVFPLLRGNFPVRDLGFLNPIT